MTEELTIIYNNEPVKVTATYTPEDTVFTVHLADGDIEITAGFDDKNEAWFEDGIQTERAAEIGWLIDHLE
jgi:hypothetical protein